jgi:hypothetical protein
VSVIPVSGIPVSGMLDCVRVVSGMLHPSMTLPNGN